MPRPGAAADRDGGCWGDLSGLPSRRWGERANRERIAQEGEALDKPLPDAYRKMDEITRRARRRQGEAQPGAVLGDGQGPDLTAKDREYLRDHLGVITHAIDSLRNATA